jgi:crotonobetaine/carnitine-CoA ligase
MIATPLEQRTVPAILAASQARGIDRPFVVTNEATYTHADVEDLVARLAGVLAGHGIDKGARVALLLERSERYVWMLLSLARLGAVAVALNTDAKGRLLSYYLEDSDCRLAITDREHADVFAEAAAIVGGPEALVLDPGEDWIERLAPGAPREATEQVDFWDPFVVLYTSGTTGMPKGVPVTHGHAITTGGVWAEFMGFGIDDRLYTCLPFFHINATAYSLCGALLSGASLAIGRHFSARRFWDDVAALQATQINGMGSMVKILQGREPHPAEQAHRARMMFLAPLPPDAAELSVRFGLDFSTTYAQTEWLPSSFTVPGDGYDRPGGVGPVLPCTELQIVGEHDEPLPAGRMGEIALRAHEPFTAFTGYLGRPQDSLDAFRNLRFHTGDLGELSDDGWLYFRGRAKDVIRRRGENISATVIEELLAAHPDIVEAAAVPVPSALLEDEVFVYVVLREGAELGADRIVRFAREVMPRHMIPLYADLVADLPRTATNKVAKAVLKERAQQAVVRGAIRPLW